LANIAQVAQSRGFYSEETERILAHDVERPGNAVIRQIMSGTAISPVERLQLAIYIGVMLKRIPAKRRRATEMIPSVLAGVVANIRDQIQALTSDPRADLELLSKRLQELDAAEKKYALRPPPEVQEIIREPWPSERILRALFGMTWRILESSGPQYFITTDNPAFFFEAFGLGREESELCFPLSTTHALHGSWQSAERDLIYVRATQAIVREVNRRLASQGRDWPFTMSLRLGCSRFCARSSRT